MIDQSILQHCTRDADVSRHHCTLLSIVTPGDWHAAGVTGGAGAGVGWMILIEIEQQGSGFCVDSWLCKYVPTFSLRSRYIQSLPAAPARTACSISPARLGACAVCSSTKSAFASNRCANKVQRSECRLASARDARPVLARVGVHSVQLQLNERRHHQNEQTNKLFERLKKPTNQPPTNRRTE